VGYAPHTHTAPELLALLEAQRAGTPFVSFRDGLGDLRLVRLQDGPLIIGRSPESDIVLDWDREVSRTHAQLEPLGTAWVVVDDGLSRNGCTVNTARLQGRRRLADGDVIRVGGTSLTFHLAAATGDTTAAAHPTVLAKLTEAERRVLVELCRPVLMGTGATSASNPAIADALCISVPSVKTHMRSLFTKLAVAEMPQNEKRAQLVGRAVDSGLVSVREL